MIDGFEDVDEMKALNEYNINDIFKLWKKIAVLQHKYGNLPLEIMERIRYDLLSIPDHKLNMKQLRVTKFLSLFIRTSKKESS